MQLTAKREQKQRGDKKLAYSATLLTENRIQTALFLLAYYDVPNRTPKGACLWPHALGSLHQSFSLPPCSS